MSVPSFQIQDRPITVGEYAEFLSSTNSCLDNNDSNDTKDLVPASWARQGMSGVVMQDYAVKTVFGLVPLSRMALTPVFCSGAQASAYADAKGMRLPTEGEMQIVRNATSSSTRISSSWNVGFSQWMPMPVVADRGIMDDDVLKCDGHGWEWTSSVFSSHDGFIASVAYPGYSADFFDGKHLVVAGRGSWATHPRIACRRSFRNWYQAGYPYVFATFRCCV